MIKKMSNVKWQMSNVKKGFTLLELLVVISIIGILVALGATSYSTAQKKARDAQRKGTLRSIGAALEQYYSVCGNVYPTSQTGGYYFNVNCPTPPLSIMPTVPVDPKSATPYLCQGGSCSGGYTICATLESESPTGYCINNQQ